MTRTAIAFDFHVALVGAPEIWRRIRMQAHRKHGKSPNEFEQWPPGRL